MPWPVSRKRSARTRRVEIFGLADRVRIDGEIARLNGERAASRHGVLRVHGQIDEHLLDLTRVGLHPSQIALRQEDQLDILFDQPAEHALEVADHVVEIDHARAPAPGGG